MTIDPTVGQADCVVSEDVHLRDLKEFEIRRIVASYVPIFEEGQDSVLAIQTHFVAVIY